MIGGLFKSASRLALVAAAGVLVGGVSAQAADLGGDCCADLEERVAELEATTVRKGNRKVSLQLSGQVHESIMYWDDGVEQNVYTGVNHINASSRFRFVGSAKINPTWSAGYLMEIETQAKSDSNDMVQNDQCGASGTGVVVRHNAWWIDNAQLGRVWLGLTDAAGAGIDGINLSNSNIAANAKIGLTNGSFRLRGNAHATNGTVGNVSNLTWANILGGNSGLVHLGDETRQNVIKYVSPTLMGFIFSAAWGEDDFWDVALRYAGEFGGFKLALGAGYAQTTDANPGGANPNLPAVGGSNHFGGCTDLAANITAFNVEQGQDRDCSSWVFAGSIMHVATGLFVSGSYGQREDGNRILHAQNTITNGNAAAFDSTDTFWQVRGGIEQNFFGIGKTTLFGEYNRFEGTPMGGSAATSGNFHNLSAANANLLGFVGATTIARSEVTAWGLGVVQTIDAAAMDLYLTYRNYSADITGVLTATGEANGTGTGIKDFSVVTFGGRIQF
jgi:hypothetical protein